MENDDFREEQRNPTPGGDARRYGVGPVCRILSGAGIRTKTRSVRSLGVFIRSIKGASVEQQQNFANWLCERLLEGEPDADALAPELLLRQFVFATLNEWSLREPHNSVPFRWLGVLKSSRGYAGMRCGLSAPDQEAQVMLQTALRLDPQDQIARVRPIECCTDILDYHAHHLPEAYLGEPEADQRIVENAGSLMSGLLDPPPRNVFETRRIGCSRDRGHYRALRRGGDRPSRRTFRRSPISMHVRCCSRHVQPP